MAAALHYLIVGNGPAGNEAAAALRASDPEARITIVSAVGHHYLHPEKLAPFVARPERSLQDLYVRQYSWYAERRIQLRLNQPVNRIDPVEKFVYLNHKERVHYDRLLLATGARPRVPERLTHYAQHLTRFSTGTDALLLKRDLGRIKHLTLLGGDCIALELAQALRPLGVKLTFILDEFRFWPIEFDEAVKKRLADSLERKGFEVIRDDLAVSVEPADGRLAVKTRGGKELRTDRACVSSGMVPVVEFLGAAGIDTQVGVLVDDHLQTNVAEIWAAGECAQVYHPELKDYRCSTGSVNAEQQGRLAARNMLGGRETVKLPEPGKVTIAGEQFITYGWKGFSLDE
jgi:NADPH-dependent 2,4-dienoyl-CoA reductase/sulfur reductase-like enzyme